MIYKNHVLKACKPEIYKTPYIGKGSREKRLQILEQEIAILKKTNEDFDKDICKYSSLQKDVCESRINETIKYNNSWNKIDLYKKSINSMKEEISLGEKY